jgi:hypothetical protein
MVTCGGIIVTVLSKYGHFTTFGCIEKQLYAISLY